MTPQTITRFYNDVSVVPRDGGYSVLLDGKPLQSPARACVILSTRSLAESVAQEWRQQLERVELARMPLTVLSYSAIDAVPRERRRVIEHILGFGRSDLLCYRAEAGIGAFQPAPDGSSPRCGQDGRGPCDLAVRQEQAWGPLLAWIAEAHGVRLQTGAGVAYIQQPGEALLAMEKVVRAQNDFQLAALDRAAALTGSLVLALALLGGRLGAPEAFAAAHVDDLYQAEKWGRDPEAEARRVHILSELEATAEFMRAAAAKT